jgi:hypothetical protein
MSNLTENPTEKSVNPMLLSLGIGHDLSLARIVYRLNHLEKELVKQNEKLGGNISVLQPFIGTTNVLMMDLIDITREAITLCAVSAFRQEQGLASPPKSGAPGGENPPTALRGVDASAQADAVGKGPE